MNRANLSARYVAVAAAILFVLGPLAHLHCRPAAEPEGSLTAQNITPSGCAACLLHAGVALTVSISTFEPLERSAHLGLSPPVPLRSVDLSYPVASRAPPIPAS